MPRVFVGRTSCFMTLAVAFITFLGVGCGGEPFRYVKARGKITYDDGTLIPAERIRLTFVSLAPPKDAKTHVRPASAEVNVTTGEFTDVTSTKFGDGLVAGKHKVLVQATDMLQNPLNVVAPEYASDVQTPLVLDTANLPWTITIPKPR